MTIAYIGLGANLGDARIQVQDALMRLRRIPQTRLLTQSSLFCSAPVDADGDDYINAVGKVKTALNAQHLLLELQSIETECGRERQYHNAPRTLDLDILLFGNKIIATETLQVPHPRMTERAFVLMPLLQIDALINIPGRGPAHQFVLGVAAQRIVKVPH
jgi:2-amino-4-hydroxy-6-hydroxymethyldihydropteridine diphosphokinase